MKNKETIDQINAYADSIEQANLTRRDLIEFNLKDIKVSDGFSIDGLELGEKAIKRVFGIFNAKPAFSEFQQLMEKADWDTVANKIKNAKGDINLYGSLLCHGDTHSVDNIFYKNQRKKNPDDLTRSKAVIATLTDVLSRSNVDWDLKDKSFDEEKSIFQFQLQDSLNPIEVLKNDFWKQGQIISFNSTEFSNTPYFERLICSNVMTRPQLGWRSNIQKASFNNSKIETALRNILSEYNSDVAELVAGYCDHLKNTTVSLREFLIYKNLFVKMGYDEVADKYFNEAPFYKAWGQNLDKKPKSWKATANTGINAYDFLNLNTWIASHPDDTKITPEDAMRVKAAISDIFVKKELDCECLAPTVKVEFPHFVEMD
jgi:hypothetical protein